MSGRPMRTFAALAGAVLLAGLAVMTLHTDRVEAASPSGSAPVMSVEPRLVVQASHLPGTPAPAHMNGSRWEVVVGVLQNTRSGNSIRNVFQPLNTSSIEIIPVGGSEAFESTCGIPTGQTNDRLTKCEFRPAWRPPDCPECPNMWEFPGYIQFVLRLATMEGDVAEDVIKLDINPMEGPPPAAPPE